MICVGRLAPKDQWDQHMLDLLFANQLWPTGVDFKRTEGYPSADHCVLIIPGRYWATQHAEITSALASYNSVLAIRTGDEEDLFDIHAVTHPNIRWWVQTPRTDRDYGNARLFGVGFPPHFSDLQAEPPGKSLRVFLSAQNTHQRRHECFDALQPVMTGFVQETPGFTQGLDAPGYVRMMADAKVSPCPAGPASPDTFRVYEALEAHAIPIADDITPGYDSNGYWRMVFPDCPFPIITDYSDLPGYIGDQLAAWPENVNRITAWWMKQKRTMAHWLVDDLKALGAL